MALAAVTVPAKPDKAPAIDFDVQPFKPEQKASASFILEKRTKFTSTRASQSLGSTCNIKVVVGQVIQLWKRLIYIHRSPTLIQMAVFIVQETLGVSGLVGKRVQLHLSIVQFLQSLKQLNQITPNGIEVPVTERRAEQFFGQLGLVPMNHR